jgi:hypothetical protein
LTAAEAACIVAAVLSRANNPGSDVRLKLGLPEINLQVVKRISGLLKPDARQEYF